MTGICGGKEIGRLPGGIPGKAENKENGWMFQGAVFDIGQTLVDYKIPMNWSKLYRPAFEHIADKYNYNFSQDQYQKAVNIMTKYNTRVYPRDYEVSSTVIFTEILDGMEIALEDMKQVKESFYAYFKRECHLYSDVEPTLRALSEKGIRLGTLSDVAYGMDNEYALEDIAAIIKYIEWPFTSNDTGYRKSCTKGLEILAEKMGTDLSDLVVVGDEEKDMACAKKAGAYAVFINRGQAARDYGQDKTIQTLTELLPMFGIVACDFPEKCMCACTHD